MSVLLGKDVSFHGEQVISAEKSIHVVTQTQIFVLALLLAMLAGFLERTKFRPPWSLMTSTYR